MVWGYIYKLTLFIFILVTFYLFIANPLSLKKTFLKRI